MRPKNLVCITGSLKTCPKIRIIISFPQYPLLTPSRQMLCDCNASGNRGMLPEFRFAALCQHKLASRAPRSYMILGLCPKPHRSALAILKANPLALRYRLMAMRPYIKASQSGARYCAYAFCRYAVICRPDEESPSCIISVFLCLFALLYRAYQQRRNILCISVRFSNAYRFGIGDSDWLYAFYCILSLIKLRPM